MLVSGRQVLGKGHHRAARSQRGAHVVRATAAPINVASDVKHKLKAADRVRLGESDLLVSACCLGTMTWGKQNTEAEAHEQLSYAWDQGINFLDTAEMYPIPIEAATQGRTDRYIGTWLKSSGRRREDVVLATKVCGFSDRATWVRNPPRTTQVSRDQIVESVDASLKRLQVDHIDLLQIHWPERYVPLFGAGPYDPKNDRPETIPFEEQLRGFEEVIKAGKVRYIGVSNETSLGVSEFCHIAKATGLPKIQTIQNAYSLLVRVPFETDLSETCRHHRVSLLAYSPLAGGMLTAKYNRLSDEALQGARFNLFPGYMARYKASLVQEAVGKYAAVADKYGLTATELALAWCKSRWFVASTIIGATTMQQLKVGSGRSQEWGKGGKETGGGSEGGGAAGR
ncbi:hypothetical protein VOLCADRAFT_80874 [Volvox carteri f. nagariensis]|uniref:NADP-dependent oxidoreductase domain-containing protein n=1 Tax=Volvox carteri f. nagariensis TaxID=3068 RepID=D8TUA1_VOLCA|nr:uncharacterized protein VOLCADRAFT_80874 [Volvox carteri f. nagariensis]EFJ49001.1 hypothetical protein VOLCADRAFT_80874 [Volvox carteri f. nagariensis]|eukprot:XP_002949898.1 hypothetical protein VOLCADRAFT_80874 [Volvox carteri f. nagariensis]